MKTTLVTGCAGGLGRAVCATFRAAGYRVVGIDRTMHQSDCNTFLQMDLEQALGSPDLFREAMTVLRGHVGSEGLHVLINNAAVQILGHTEALTFDDWHRSVMVNVTAPLFLTQAFLPELEKARGTVINVGSVHTRATKPRFVAYATTKAALVGLTRAMAIDLAPRVRVVAINPGAVNTAMLRAGFEGRTAGLEALAKIQPAGRIASPDEISNFVLFLASDHAAFATGTAFDIDGGILSRLHDVD